MTAPPTILVYGSQPSLLQTRRWLFERAGFHVVTSLDRRDVETSLRSRTPDLLVLCHSLRPEDCLYINTVLETLNPRPRQIRMGTGPTTPPQTDGNRVVSIFDGPQSLLNAAEDILQTA